MQVAPKPENEIDRLAALHELELLDSDPDPAFDDITYLASMLLGTPIALVSLVDAERQWFKSRVGLDVCETGRDIAFCSHALHEPDILEVRDASDDQRFCDNPLVTGEPHIRFYAGMPLWLDNGHVVGTLCVIDQIPRRLSEHQRDLLRRLGRQVVEHLQRMSTERALRESEQRRQLVMQRARLAFWTVDLNTLTYTFNDQFYELLGTTAEEEGGYTSSLEDFVTRFIHPDDRAQFFERINSESVASLSEEEAAEQRYRVRRRDNGEVAYIASTVDVRVGADGSPLGNTLFGVVQDVTRDEVQARSLREAREMAESASKAKSAFLANMSHEIRTPLNALVGLVELLEHADSAQDRADNLTMVREAASTLSTMIDDVLDLSKIEAGKLEKRIEVVELDALINTVVNLFSSTASTKNIRLDRVINANLPAAVETDPIRLRQILLNLIGNAIKFTREGSVTVTAELKDHHDTQGMLCVSVTDTGIGIDAEAQKHLFQPFAQAGAEVTANYGGTGLGLALSRRLAGLLGGELNLQSTLGEGSTLTLQIPVKIAAASEVSAGEKTSSAQSATVELSRSRANGQRILIVDDNRINRKVLKRQLEVLGFVVETAEDGEEGLQKWLTGGQRIVITDCHMPGLDGFGLTMQLRKRVKRRKLDVPPVIIGYTADALLDSRERCLAAGMDDVLYKPVSLEDIAAMLDKYLESDDALGLTDEAGPATQDDAVDAVDFAALVDHVGGDAEFAREVLVDFVQEKRAELEALVSALDTVNAEQARRLLHRLKASSGVVGAKRFSALCERIEAAVKKNEWPAFESQIRGRFAEIEAWVAQHNAHID